MTDVLDKALAEPQQQPAGDESQGEQQQQPAEGLEAAAGDAPPASNDTEKHVPLAALEAVRGERKDWKEKALRYEGELKALREQRQPAAEPQQQVQVDPLELNVRRAESLFLDLSEKTAIQEHGKELVDAAFEWFDGERKKNPALHQQVLSGRDPYGDMVAMHKRHQAMAEIGEDPVAFRARVRAEIEAELKGSVATNQPAQPEARIPASLAAARSSGARGTTWTGPRPLTSIL